MIKKKCKLCGVPKDLDKFHKVATSNDGRYHICKVCNNLAEGEKRKARRQIVDDFFNMFL